MQIDNITVKLNIQMNGSKYYVRILNLSNAEAEPMIYKIIAKLQNNLNCKTYDLINNTTFYLE